MHIIFVHNSECAGATLNKLLINSGLVLSACRYRSLFDKACGISFIYKKNNIGPNIDPWGTPQFMVAASENTLSNEKKKTMYGR